MVARTAAVVGAICACCALVPQMLEPPPNTESWLMFDGVCNLCDGFINFVADHDELRRVKFGTLIETVPAVCQRSGHDIHARHTVLQVLSKSMVSYWSELAHLLISLPWC